VYKKAYFCVLIKKAMRTNIVLNDKLVRDVMRLSKAKTKKDVVELALENLLRTLKRRQIRELFGKVKWEGDLAKMREA
jgi:Arc/MetJ family transcription regulator